MKEGFISDASGIPNQQELAAINRLSRRTLSADEVFVFSVVLCDNDIDRDFERFSENALSAMQTLFVGKTGIFDHSMKGRDQVARIFSCEVEKPGGQTTHDGRPYVRLKARAYMPVTEKNKALIMEIDSGIKKEVSVGCAVDRVVCSICGADVKHDRCEHRKGSVYHTNGADRVCCHVLDHPTDAYEWSFVAVPAQPAAGVVKAFGGAGKGENALQPQTIVKSLQEGKSVTLTAKEAAVLADYVQTLQTQAEDGRRHRDALVKEVARLGGLAQADMDPALLQKMLAPLGYEDLCAVKDAFTKQLNGLFPPRSQLEPAQPAQSAQQPACEPFLI